MAMRKGHNFCKIECSNMPMQYDLDHIMPINPTKFEINLMNDQRLVADTSFVTGWTERWKDDGKTEGPTDIRNPIYPRRGIKTSQSFSVPFNLLTISRSGTVGTKHRILQKALPLLENVLPRAQVYKEQAKRSVVYQNLFFLFLSCLRKFLAYKMSVSGQLPSQTPDSG